MTVAALSALIMLELLAKKQPLGIVTTDEVDGKHAFACFSQ